MYPYSTHVPHEGDVIRSHQFAYGYYRPNSTSKNIEVDGKTVNHPVTYQLSERERIAIAAKTGCVDVPYEVVEDHGAYDESRGTAEFVVEATKFHRGGPTETGPSGTYVLARRLNSDRTYDSENEAIRYWALVEQFVQLEQPVEVIRKMKKVITFVNDS